MQIKNDVFLEINILKTDTIIHPKNILPYCYKINTNLKIKIQNIFIK